MTPKEKAKELVKKFSSFAHDEFGNPKINNYKAKQCALIAVDEILTLTIEKDNIYYYYLEVKKEIEKL